MAKGLKNYLYFETNQVGSAGTSYLNLSNEVLEQYTVIPLYNTGGINPINL